MYIENGSCSTEAVREEALQLVYDGLEMKLLSILNDILSSVFSEKAVCLFSYSVTYPLNIYVFDCKNTE